MSIGEKGQVFSDVAQCASVRFATHSLIFTKSPEVEVNAAPVLIAWNSTLVMSFAPLRCCEAKIQGRALVVLYRLAISLRGL